MELKSEMNGMKRKHEELEERSHKEHQVSELPPKAEHRNQTEPSNTSCNVTMSPSVSRRIAEAEKAKMKVTCLRQRFGTLKSFKHQYGMLQFLGEGSFGQVVKCLKIGTDENVAVKIFRNASDSFKYFNNECAILRILNDNDPDKFNFVRSLECFEYQKRYCLVFEYLEQTLYDYIKENGRKPVPLEGILSISEQVLTALLKLKELKIIHTDIKTANIMLVNHKRHAFKIKIIDFGGAIRLPAIHYPSKVQTIHYRAPEVLLRLSYSESVDMWSFGCVLAEMLLGKILYPGMCEYDQIRYICQTQGFPPKEMLDFNHVAREYFCFKTTNSTDVSAKYKWSLKTLEEYKRRYDHPEPTKVCDCGLKTLDDIIKKYEHHGVANTHRTSEESVSVAQCVDLLKKTLAIAPKNRISPEDALKHIFIQSGAPKTDNSQNDSC